MGSPKNTEMFAVKLVRVSRETLGKKGTHFQITGQVSEVCSGPWTPVWGCKERPAASLGGEDLSHLIRLQRVYLFKNELEHGNGPMAGPSLWASHSVPMPE